MSAETFKARYLGQSENAVKIQYLGIDAWLPRSQIEKLSIVGDRCDLKIPYWLYKEKFEDAHTHTKTE